MKIRTIARAQNDQFLRWLSKEADPRDPLVPFPEDQLLAKLQGSQRTGRETVCSHTSRHRVLFEQLDDGCHIEVPKLFSVFVISFASAPALTGPACRTLEPCP
jgi:hypothetical protein